MTCVVAIAHEGHVHIGADSAGTDGALRQTIRADEKVFVLGPFVMGFTSSFRMGQLLRYKLTVAEQPSTLSDLEFLHTWFIDAVRTTLKDGGYSKTESNVETGGCFLLGYKGQLYQVESDFQLGRPVQPYAAIGCGAEYSLGALDLMAKTGWKDPDQAIRQAIDVAAYRSAGVAGPVVIVKGGSATPTTSTPGGRK